MRQLIEEVTSWSNDLAPRLFPHIGVKHEREKTNWFSFLIIFAKTWSHKIKLATKKKKKKWEKWFHKFSFSLKSE
jgi:hypothetical protein